MDWTLAFVSVFAIFIPALMLPGPDFIGVVRSSMARGTRAGLMTTLGVTIGLGFYAGLSLIGLSAVLLEYQWLAWTVRICGGLYLGYLGIRLLMTRPASLDLDGGNDAGTGNPLVFGFLVTLTNPKAIVLFTSVFATAVTDAMPLWVMAAMVGLVMASAAIWYTLVTLFMSSRPVIARFENAQHWIERAAGVCFIGIGAKILADSRNPLTP
ncbi:putative threonine efflux protein [Hoeflea sp. IMCC20628]|uniref:LysE family translocator n=1 Tax=Hoeflea sp. IMCC20628 TaxID=1620421 RepID=UPI00063ADFCB|nr:LysE family translocator [Hoeflea sp. IMCC20628]AKI01272.1 putative threonine efflux protein [Hoeflea sp. IMCC20628]